MKDMDDAGALIARMGAAARDAAAELAFADPAAKSAALEAAAEAVTARTAAIIEENAKDLAFGRDKGLTDAIPPAGFARR